MNDIIKRMFDFSTWQISPVDVGVIIGYLVLMMVVGWLCKGISRNVSDYVRMGCKSTWWLMGTSIFMLMTSAGTFTGGAAQAYMSGWSFVLSSFTGFFGYLLMAAFFAPWMRRTRTITPTDTIRLRYGPVVEQFNAYIGQAGSMLWGGTWLLGLANFLAVIFNIPVPTVIVFVGLVTIFYSVSGGSWSVQITDTLQAYVLIPIALVVLFLSLDAVGGLGGLMEAVKAKGLQDDYKILMEKDHQYTTDVAKVGLGYFTVGWIFASLIYRFLLSANMTACWRFLSCKTDGDARKAAVLTGSLLFLGSFVWYVPAMVARVQFEEDVMALGKAAVVDDAQTGDGQPSPVKTPKLNNPADGAYAVIAKKVLPPGLLGLVVIGLLAATMSSMDSSLTGNAGIITNNIYPPLMRLFGKEPWAGVKLLRLTQVVNLLLGVWAITLALILWRMTGERSIYDVGLEIIGMISAPMVTAMVLSFFVRKLPWWAPMVGMTCGLASSLTFLGMDVVASLPWHYRIFITMGVTIVPTYACTAFWFTASESYRRRVDNFFKQIRTPIDFEKEVGQAVDHTLMKMIGKLGWAIAGVILVLIFFAKDDQGRFETKSILGVLFVSGFIATMSMIMLLVGRHKERQLALTKELDQAASTKAAD